MLRPLFVVRSTASLEKHVYDDSLGYEKFEFHDFIQSEWSKIF